MTETTVIPGVDRALTPHEIAAWTAEWTRRRQAHEGVPFRRFAVENPPLETRVREHDAAVGTTRVRLATSTERWLPEVERNRLLKRAGRL